MPINKTGLLCPACGAQTRTLDTRKHADGYVLRRRRRCMNEHVFVTYEINDTAWGSVAAVVMANSLAATRRAMLHRRNTTIIRLAQTMTLKQVAVKFDIKPNTVSYILHKYGDSPDRRKSKL